MSLITSPRETAATVLGLVFVGYHVWAVIFGVPEPLLFRSTHLAFVFVLTFLLFPSWRDGEGRAVRGAVALDLLLIAAALGSLSYIFLNYDQILRRFAYVTPVTSTEWIAGGLCVLLVLEMARRTIGWSLPITAVLFLAYVLVFTRVRDDLLLEQMFLTTEGIFGVALGVSASYMVMFILFGAFVEKMGTGKLFMDSASAVAGHAAGGPAKIAVLTSALFGSISGSPTANVMTTGAFTIPLMKKLGYRPAFAGAVEAVASTGGQILPPIMGAAAFVMVEFLGTSYASVMAMAIIPAALFFIAVFSAVHFEARRTGVEGLARETLPHLGAVLRERGHQVVPLVAIVALLIAGYSAPYAAFWSAMTVAPIALMRRGTRPEVTFRSLLDTLTATARNVLTVAIACACAGIVVGAVTLSGLTLTFTQIVVDVSGNSLMLALVLCAIAGIVIAMGLPTTPAYILQTALLVPALVSLGVATPAAHFFVLYFAVLSVITPPVAITIFAACGLSGAGVWPTGGAALRLAASGYIIPFMFVYHPELLMIGAWPDILLAAASAGVGVIALSSGLNRFLLCRNSLVDGLLLISGAIALMHPSLPTDSAGVAAIGLTLARQARTLRHRNASENKRISHDG